LGVFDGFIGFIGRYKINFIKLWKVIKLFYNRTYAEVHYKKKSKGSQKIKVMGGVGGSCGFHLHLLECFIGQECRGGGSVRRRNTLYVVGGRQIIICHKRGLWGERNIL
jgi:hypothetical protein